ncbi:MAG TPA: hypothetical protein DDZ51_30510 [Planctomycetaceae bacterium]|nr:hypothetical protein [Planctomycetaceae bacterium]
MYRRTPAAETFKIRRTVIPPTSTIAFIAHNTEIDNLGSFTRKHHSTPNFDATIYHSPGPLRQINRHNTQYAAHQYISQRHFLAGVYSNA